MNVIDLAGVRLSAGYFNSIYAFPRRRTATLCCRQGWELICFDTESVVSVEGKEYALAKGSVLCLRPDEEWRVALPGRWYYVRMEQPSADMEGLLQAFGRLPSSGGTEQVKEWIADISVAQRAGDALQCTAKLVSLLSLLQKESETQQRMAEKGRAKTKEAIRAGLDYISLHYREKCTLKEIAAYAGRSPIYFHDVFSEVMGMTPYEYIAQLRLEEAKRLLLTTDEDPADIAERIGFCSQSYFNFVFKKALGTTPLNFRRAAAEEYLPKEE